MQENETQPTELEKLQFELLSFVADRTALGALNDSNPVLGQKVVEAIAATVDQQTARSVAKELASFRTELRKELGEIAHAGRPSAQPDWAEPATSVPEPLPTQSSPHETQSDGENQAPKGKSGRHLTGVKRNFFPVAAALLLGGAIMLGFWLNEAKSQVHNLQTKVKNLCDVKAKIALQLDKAEPVKLATDSSAQPPAKTLGEEIYSTLSSDRSCPEGNPSPR